MKIVPGVALGRKSLQSSESRQIVFIAFQPLQPPPPPPPFKVLMYLELN